MMPYKRDVVTLNKAVINYLPKCTKTQEKLHMVIHFCYRDLYVIHMSIFQIPPATNFKTVMMYDIFSDDNM